MTDTPVRVAAEGSPEIAETPAIVVSFSPVELELLRAALRLLKSTLGRDEAEELAEVRELLHRIEAPATR